MATSWREERGLQDTSDKQTPQLPFVARMGGVFFLNFLQNICEEKGLFFLVPVLSLGHFKALAEHATSPFSQTEIVNISIHLPFCNVCTLTDV